MTKKLIETIPMKCGICGKSWEKQIWKTENYTDILLHGYCGCGDKVQRETKMELPSFFCNRCNHKWIPRANQEPKVCPKCKSPYWNKKRVRK